MENPFDDFNDIPQDENLKGIAAIAKQLVAAEQEVQHLEELLTRRKEELHHLSTRVLPEAMQEVGLSEFTTDKGDKILVQERFHCSLPKEESVRAEAFVWLRDNEAGALIKRNIVLQFGKGEDQRADDLVKALKLDGLTPTDKPDVHWKTLTSWAKEQHEKGVALPKDLLGLYIGMEAKVKRS
jgi:hypothetical protein